MTPLRAKSNTPRFIKVFKQSSVNSPRKAPDLVPALDMVRLFQILNAQTKELKCLLNGEFV